MVLLAFPQEYGKFKSSEDSTFPSVYIALKDKLSGIRKVITDSTVHLIQLLENYKEKLQEFAAEGGGDIWAVGSGGSSCACRSGWWGLPGQGACFQSLPFKVKLLSSSHLDD